MKTKAKTKTQYERNKALNEAVRHINDALKKLRETRDIVSSERVAVAVDRRREKDKIESAETKADELVGRAKALESAARHIDNTSSELRELRSIVFSERIAVAKEWIAVESECEHDWIETDCDPHRRVYVCSLCGKEDRR